MVASEENNYKKKALAKESAKMEKTRRKLEGRLQQMEQLYTKEALKQKKVEMHRWIRRHEEHRVSLSKKNISIFDENNNSAPVSIRVAELAAKLKSEGSSR